MMEQVFLPMVSAAQSCQVGFLVFGYLGVGCGSFLPIFFNSFFFSNKQIASFEVNSNFLGIIGMNYFPAIKVLLQFLIEIFVVVFY